MIRYCYIFSDVTRYCQILLNIARCPNMARYAKMLRRRNMTSMIPLMSVTGVSRCPLPVNLKGVIPSNIRALRKHGFRIHGACAQKLKYNIQATQRAVDRELLGKYRTIYSIYIYICSDVFFVCLRCLAYRLEHSTPIDWPDQVRLLRLGHIGADWIILGQ